MTKATLPFAFVIATVAALMALPLSASAAPGAGLNAQGRNAPPIVKVGWKRRHHCDHDVRAPFTDVETCRSGTRVWAPFVFIDTTDGQVHVRAPFVNLFTRKDYD
jgi:hypothetical protein